MKYFITRYPILSVRHSFRHKTWRERQPDWQLDTGGEMLAVVMAFYHITAIEVNKKITTILNLLCKIFAHMKGFLCSALHDAHNLLQLQVGKKYFSWLWLCCWLTCLHSWVGWGEASLGRKGGVGPCISKVTAFMLELVRLLVSKCILFYKRIKSLIPPTFLQIEIRLKISILGLSDCRSRVRVPEIRRFSKLKSQ